MNVVHSHRKARPERSQHRAAQRSRPGPGSPEPPVARREVKPPEERRRDILDAALTLFAGRGFNETTVQDIAAAAGMGTGTVYLYFPSKEHVLQGLHERFRDESAQHVAGAAVEAIERAGRGEAVDYRDTVDAILDALAEHFAASRELVTVCTKYRPELIDPEYNPATEHIPIVARALSEGVRLGMIHTSDPEMTGRLFDAALAYNLHTHITYGDPPDMQRLVAAAKEMIHKSLALPEAPSARSEVVAPTAKGRRSSGRHKDR